MCVWEGEGGRMVVVRGRERQRGRERRERQRGRERTGQISLELMQEG